MEHERREVMTMISTSNKHDSMAVDVAAVEYRMLSVCGETVLLDCDVVTLYGVETKHVNQAIYRSTTWLTTVKLMQNWMWIL